MKRYLDNSPFLYERGKEPTPCKMANPDQKVRGYMYNMQTYLEDNVAKFKDKYPTVRLKNAATPFIDEAKLAQGCVGQDEAGSPGGGTTPCTSEDRVTGR